MEIVRVATEAEVTDSEPVQEMEMVMEMETATLTETGLEMDGDVS